MKMMVCLDCLAWLPFRARVHQTHEACPECGKFNVCGCGGCVAWARRRGFKRDNGNYLRHRRYENEKKQIQFKPLQIVYY